MISKVLAVLCFFVAVIQASVDTEQQSDGLTSLPEALLSRSRRSCGPRECNDHCKRLGHARGVCIGTYCQCRSRLRRSLENDTVYNNEDDFEIREVAPMVNDGEISKTSAEVNSFTDLAKSRSARGTCGYDECNRFCRKLGHARGVCIGNYCQCRFRRRRSVTQELERENIDVKSETNQNADEKLTASIPGVSRRVCFEAECSSHCRKMGYVRGVCIGTRCQCRAQ